MRCVVVNVEEGVRIDAVGRAMRQKMRERIDAVERAAAPLGVILGVEQGMRRQSLDRAVQHVVLEGIQAGSRPHAQLRAVIAGGKERVRVPVLP